MFGYVQPLKCELKMREYDYYRAAYCGLCNALRARCGIKARFIVNYDFVFLALVISAATESSDDISFKKRRCIVCPQGRRCAESNAFSTAADASVILTYLKLEDDMRDSKSIKDSLVSRIARFFLKSAYKKAVKNSPDYASRARKLLDELCRLEKIRVPSLDETADKFALMLSDVIIRGSKNERVLHQMLYHIGRFVYIVDALDDFEKDCACGEYNPIAERFGIYSGTLPDNVTEEILITLEQSRVSVLRAFELIDIGDAAGVIRNIIEYGMPATVKRVIDKREKMKNERPV